MAVVKLRSMKVCMKLCCALFQEKVESLKAELRAVAHSKAMLEKELQEVISLTSTELEEYQEKVMELEDEVGTKSLHCRIFSAFTCVQ